ncbi:hypothetical protein GMB34_11835 [Turicibacter sanguinis]|jgi:hypothetical protein|nr:hypothetical protein [Turicibacter sanguinis]DAN56615.1 MAG TPA: hypothetical protein [Caudoviricetes sp.]MTN84884.1 hypothetical protein [Turicibacter sanguinis]MTN87706.1 hypothetical protein [Turicibacter sanguinis]MTN90528.1 hypothetical protein [Turicibacter sanguinis]
MNETYSKLAHTELLSTKEIETIKRIQQQVTKAMEPYNEQMLKIKHSLAPTLNQIANLQEQYKEAVCPVVSALNQQEEILRPIVSNLNKHQETLIPIYQTIANTLNNLDISQNPDILQEPASNFFDEELLEEIPRTLNSLENEVSELPESDKMLEIMVFLQILFMNCDITIEKIMIYVDFIQLIFSILGVTFPSEEQPQVINIYGDINIHIENPNNLETTSEQITDLLMNE